MNSKPNMIFLNRSFDKKRLKALLLWFRLNLSEGAALKAVEVLQGLGFRSATQGAISLGLDDLKTPASKGGRVFQAQLEVALAHHEHHRGNRTPVELFQHLVDTWHRTSQDLTAEVVQLFHSTERVNPVYMMAFSGARGNISQVRQLVGMRGLMADPRGQIVGFPILSNFREGLTITEYFVSCYGARKGVVDTAIRTADAGYLTRRLADVSHHVVVRTTNCGTHRNIRLRDIKEGQKTILSLSSRLVGRVLAEDIGLDFTNLPKPSNVKSASFGRSTEVGEGNITSISKKFAFRNEEITPDLASKLASQYLEISVRSPLSCSLRWGVCQLCYGWGLSEGRRVTLGEAVGIIAAQSIGEPGTQLTLRTFHTGGVFSGDLLNEIRAPYIGIVLFPQPLQGLLVRTPHGQIAFLTKVSGKMIVSSTNNTLLPSSAEYMEGNLKDDELSTPPLTDPNSSLDPLLGVPASPLSHANAKEEKNSMTTQGGKQRKDCAPEFLAKGGNGKTRKQNQEFLLQPSTVIFVRQKEQVYQNQLLAEFSSSNLQSTNDQIEVTQQVLSEAAGQVWFKEIHYGNRKGPGSGPLGTHFSSQKLGGIWVLAGSPMPIASPFNDRKPFFLPLSSSKQLRSFSLNPVPLTSEGDKKISKGLPPSGVPSYSDPTSRTPIGANELVSTEIDALSISSFGQQSLIPKKIISSSKITSLSLSNKFSNENFFGHQRLFTKNSLQRNYIHQNRLKNYKISIINLQHDYHFFKYHYLFGYSQLIRCVNSLSHSRNNTKGNLWLTPTVQLSASQAPRGLAQLSKPYGVSESGNTFLPFVNYHYMESSGTEGSEKRGSRSVSLKDNEVIYDHHASLRFCIFNAPEKDSFLTPEVSSSKKTLLSKSALASIGIPIKINNRLCWNNLETPSGWRPAVKKSQQKRGVNFFFLPHIRSAESSISTVVMSSNVALEKNSLSLRFLEFTSILANITGVRKLAFLMQRQKEALQVHKLSLKNYCNEINDSVMLPTNPPSGVSKPKGLPLSLIRTKEDPGEYAPSVQLRKPKGVRSPKKEVTLAHFPRGLEQLDRRFSQLRKPFGVDLSETWCIPEGLTLTLEDRKHSSNSKKPTKLFTIRTPLGCSSGEQYLVNKSWQAGYGFRQVSFWCCINSWEYLFANIDQEEIPRNNYNLAVGGILKFHKNTFEMGTVDKAHFLLGTQIFRKDSNASLNIPVSWWLPKERKTTPGILLKEPFFSNNNKTQGQLFWLLNPHQGEPSNWSLQNRTLIWNTFITGNASVSVGPGYTEGINSVCSNNLHRRACVAGMEDPARQALRGKKTLWGKSQRGMCKTEKGNKIASVVHYPWLFLFANHKSQNVPVITKLVQTLDLNWRKCGVTNRGIFSPLEQNYTFERFTNLICQRFLNDHTLTGNTDTFGLHGVEENLSTFYNTEGASAFFEQLLTSENSRKKEVSKKRTSVSSSKIAALAKTQIKTTLAKQKINKLLTINPFWQALALTNYPNQTRSSRNIDYLKGYTPLEPSGKVRNSSNSPKNLGLRRDISHRIPPLGENLRFQRSTNSLIQPQDLAKIPTRLLSSIPFNYIYSFPNHGKEKGKNKIVSIHKPVWLSIHLSSNNLSPFYLTPKMYYSTGVGTSSFLNPPGFEPPLGDNVQPNVSTLQNNKCQKKTSLSKKIYSKSTDKIWNMRNTWKVGARKKQIERNDGSLDQHIVHTLHLPVVPFPYIIQPHYRYSQGASFVKSVQVPTSPSRSKGNIYTDITTLTATLGVKKNSYSKNEGMNIGSYYPLRGSASQRYSQSGYASNMQKPSFTTFPQRACSAGPSSKISSKASAGITTLVTREGNSNVVGFASKIYSEGAAPSVQSKKRQSEAVDSAACGRTTKGVCCTNLHPRVPKGVVQKNKWGMSSKEDAQEKKTFGVKDKRASEKSLVVPLPPSVIRSEKKITCFSNRQSKSFGKLLSTSDFSQVTTSYHSNCGTPVQGNLLPLIRQNLWEESCNKNPKKNVTLPMRTIINSQGKYTSTYLKLPHRNRVAFTLTFVNPVANCSFVFKSIKSAGYSRLLTFGHSTENVCSINLPRRACLPPTGLAKLIAGIENAKTLWVLRYAKTKWGMSSKESVVTKMQVPLTSEGSSASPYTEGVNQKGVTASPCTEGVNPGGLPASPVSHANATKEVNVEEGRLSSLPVPNARIQQKPSVSNLLLGFTNSTYLVTKSLHPLYGNPRKSPEIRFGLMPLKNSTSPHVGTFRSFIGRSIPSGSFDPLMGVAASPMFFGNRVPEKDYSSLQEIPYTNCFSLMRRIMEYPIERFTFNRWVTNRRRKLKYSPFSTTIPNKLIGVDNIHPRLSNTVAIPQVVPRFLPPSVVRGEKDQSKDNELLPLAVDKEVIFGEENPLPVINKIFAKNKKFIYLDHPIYLNWYSCHLILDQVKPFATYQSLLRFATFENSTARFFKLLQTIPYPEGVRDIFFEIFEFTSQGKAFSSLKTQSNTPTYTYGPAITPYGLTPRRRVTLWGKHGVKKAVAKIASLYKKYQTTVLGASPKYQESVTSLPKPLLTESDQVTFAADHFVERRFILPDSQGDVTLWRSFLNDESNNSLSPKLMEDTGPEGLWQGLVTKSIPPIFSTPKLLTPERAPRFAKGVFQKKKWDHQVKSEIHLLKPMAVKSGKTKPEESRRILKGFEGSYYPLRGSASQRYSQSGYASKIQLSASQAPTGLAQLSKPEGVRKPKVNELLKIFNFSARTNPLRGVSKENSVTQTYNTFDLFPGQLIAYGENINNSSVTTESGQVLYIDSQKTTLRKAQTVLIYSQAIIAVLSGEWIRKGTPLMALSYQKLVTGDIVQGLPKIEQFFEAPVLKDGTFWGDSLQAKLNQFFQEHREQLPLAEAVRKGFSEIQRVLIEGVQRVYISQGVLIADKHLEVIVRQMTCKGRILYSGDTGFLRNELVSLDKIESVNQVTYGQKALYHPQVRGITDASLESESFLSAASFQETTRVLSRDAIIGKTDLMRGLKERVIVGELVQAGTGLANNNVYNLL